MTKSTCRFTWDHLNECYQEALKQGFRIMTCKEFVEHKAKLPPKVLVNRIDIDHSATKARRMADLLNDLKIKGSFFVRLHAKEYNPFGFEPYRVLRHLESSGHEIGLHSEIVDAANIWNEDTAACLKRDLAVLGSLLGRPVTGAASHGDHTEFNNLDFWKSRKPKDFGLLYEAYDQEPAFDLFRKSFYISDSLWTSWKTYDQGKSDDPKARKCLCQHLRDPHPLVYLLVHPDTYFRDHFYEE